MATYVLVHGAWHGGWCWQRVARHLRAAGHEVLAPTLTGLGDRSRFLTKDVDLSTHVEDLVAVFDYEQPSEAILVGHSYAGLVLSGAAGRLAGRVRRFVYLDAFVPDDGACALDLLPGQVSSAMRTAASAAGDGWLIPPRPLEALGVVDDEAAAWLRPRLGPHPLASYEEPVHLTTDLSGLEASFIVLTGWAAVFAPFAARAASFGWPVEELSKDHEALATAPAELAAALIIAGGQSSPTLPARPHPILDALGDR